MSRTLRGRFRDAMKIMLMVFKGLGFGVSGGFGENHCSMASKGLYKDLVYRQHTKRTLNPKP